MTLDFRTVFQRALGYEDYLQKYAIPENLARWKASYDSISLHSQQQQLLASFGRKMHVLCLAGAWCGDCIASCPIFQKFAEHSLLIDLRFVHRVQDFNPDSPAPHNTVYKPGTASDPEDIRSKPIGKILVKWGILNQERVEKALLTQEAHKATGLNVRIGDVMTQLGLITEDQRDAALAAQSGYDDLETWDHAIAKELSICGAPRVPMLLFLSEDFYECGRFGERTLATYRNKIAKQRAGREGASCPTGLALPASELQSANIAEWLGHFERIQWMLTTSPRLQQLHHEV